MLKSKLDWLRDNFIQMSLIIVILTVGALIVLALIRIANELQRENDKPNPSPTPVVIYVSPSPEPAGTSSGGSFVLSGSSSQLTGNRPSTGVSGTQGAAGQPGAPGQPGQPGQPGGGGIINPPPICLGNLCLLE